MRLSTLKPVGLALAALIFAYSDGSVSAQASDPNTVENTWRDALEGLLLQWECRTAADLVREVREAGGRLTTEVRASFAQYCGEERTKAFFPTRTDGRVDNIWPITNRRARTNPDLPLKPGDPYREDCQAPATTYPGDGEAIWRAVLRADPDPGVPPNAHIYATPAEKRFMACSHRALRRAIALENKGSNTEDTLEWFWEARLQGSTAARAEVSMRLIDGRLGPDTWFSGDPDREALAWEWGESAVLIIEAAIMDYPPAYRSAARIIFDDPINPYDADDPHSKARPDQDDLALCFLARAWSAADRSVFGRDAQTEIAAEFERALRELDTETIIGALGLAGTQAMTCGGFTPDYDWVSALGRDLNAPLATRQRRLMDGP